MIRLLYNIGGMMYNSYKFAFIFVRINALCITIILIVTLFNTYKSYTIKY